MARLRLPLPTPVIYRTSLEIRIEHINYGQHVSNDSYLRLAHEARLRWLKSAELSEIQSDQTGLIMSDASLVYKAEARWGEILWVDLGVTDLTTHSFDLIYLFRSESGVEYARCKTAMVGFNYQTKKVAPLSEAYLQLISTRAKQ